MLKRIAATFFIITLLCTTCAYAKTVEFILDEPTYSAIDNYQKETSALLAPPFIQNDRTMIPVRAVSESFDSFVVWDPDARAVTITKGDKTVRLVIDSLTAYVNETEMALDAAPCIVNDTTFVPVRFVTEALGYDVTFVPRTRSVLICDQQDVLTIDGTAVTYPEFEALCYLLAQPDLTGDDLINYTTGYLVKNAVLQNAANSASLSLSAERSSNIDLALERYGENTPFTKGAYALLMENEELGLEYLDSVYDQDAVLDAYENKYICAKHILISGGTDSENEALANQVYQEAQNGADFDALIAEYGSDPGTEYNPDGYVFTSGEMVASFETAAASLNEGEISQPVKSEFGYHIIKRLPLPPLSDEVQSAIMTDLYITPLIERAVIS